MPLRGDRIHRYVNAFCPLCHEEPPGRPLAKVQRLSGRLVERGGRIWLERCCTVHGLVRTLYDESPEILTYLEEWTAPTKVHTPDVAGKSRPSPRRTAGGPARTPTGRPMLPARACPTRRSSGSGWRSLFPRSSSPSPQASSRC
ncbi:MAG: Radical [Marmoricola sp.]|nr:Radical [Marmoricola sp.]